ncbi:MAG: methionine synthase [Candidatus Rifleibacteriota bacterium]
MQRISVEEFHKLINEKVLIFDGAMGTSLQAMPLKERDFGGYKGCSEALILYAPDAIKIVHKDFIQSGCQVIETNTFNATSIGLKEYGLENEIDKINRKAVEIAREAIDEVETAEPVLIAGSVGPTSKLPSLNNISFDEMSEAYYEQFKALFEAGIDILQIETCQDLLQIKSALYAAETLFAEKKQRCAVNVSVTLESSGTMLIGSDVHAIIASLEPYSFIDMLSINCATGPGEMVRHVDHLVNNWPGAVGVMPNAGLPVNVKGKPVYNMKPEEFAGYIEKFVKESGVNMVGGCCGTTPQHLAAVVEKVAGHKPPKRKVRFVPQVASLFSAVALRQNPAPTLIGERTNANGAKQFRGMLKNEDWDGMVAMGREQVKAGAHLVDLCVAYAGRNELNDINTLVPRFAAQINLPLVIDSTSPEAIEAALKLHGGRCVINSVNLEDGGRRLDAVAKLAHRFGAALICLAIDENGMAKTAEEKLKILNRLFKLLTKKYALRPADLIFDPLTFTVGSGEVSLRNSAAETLKALKLINEGLPEVNTILGLSNVSFGLNKAGREILNSVFLQEAVSAGLTCAIVNPAGILPGHKITPEERKVALNLIYNPGGDGTDLTRFIEFFTDENKRHKKLDVEKLTPKQHLKEKVIDGDKSEIENLLEKLLNDHKPHEIINQILLPAMKEVGELFGSGKLQLPFVLQSAEVVKNTVDILQPLMEKVEPSPDKRVILATVAGDVHDIGKNLVNIMLSNNGYNVYDLGIKIDIEDMIKAAKDHNSKIIGMSGLLVRSTEIMKENLEELNRRNFFPTVILGGAALTKDFVEKELQPIYNGRVYYARDTVDAVSILEKNLSKNEKEAQESIISKNTGKSVKKKDNINPDEELVGRANRHQFVANQNIIKPPFYGRHLLEISSKDLFALLSHKVLFEARWGFKKGSLTETEYKKIIEEKARPALNKFIKEDQEEILFKAQAVYGYFRCKARGNKIKIFDDAEITIGEFEFPRQKKKPGLCLADFISEEKNDLIALWAVTLGKNIIEEGRKRFADDKFCDYHLLHGLGSELADCAAVYVHRQIHRELFPGQTLTKGQLQGCRYSFGYPACPDLSSQKDLLRILDARKIGIELSESFQMVPELSVSGFILLNPFARYFVP